MMNNNDINDKQKGENDKQTALSWNEDNKTEEKTIKLEKGKKRQDSA